MKVARTVLSGGKDGDNFKVLPVATAQQGSQRNEITACKKRSPTGNITGLHQVELCRIHKGF